MTHAHILIIDDDEGQHLLLESQLKLSGYEVLHAYSGEEAIAIVTQQPVDLVLLDINMPGMDGFQTLTAFRSRPNQADIPVILLTSLDRQYLKVKGLEGGADDYLTKPFDNAELTARIKAVLRRTSKQNTLPAGTMQGHIEAVGLAELLQGMALAAKTCTIALPDMAGEILIRKGVVLKISQGPFTGRDALIRLILLQRGNFVVTYDEIDESAAEELSTIEHLLLFSVSQADEIKEKCKELAPPDMLVKLNGDPRYHPSLAAVSANLPLTIVELVATMADDLDSNLQVVRDALSHGVIDYQVAQQG